MVNIVGAKSQLKKQFIVRKAKPSELQWLYENQHLFEVGYRTPPGFLRKEWPCFVMIHRGQIVGFKSFEFHEAEGRVNPWVGTASLRKGFEGRGLGRILSGKANAFLHSKGFYELSLHAHNPRAKNFWQGIGFKRVEGAEMHERGNTKFRLDLRRQRVKLR